MTRFLIILAAVACVASALNYNPDLLPKKAVPVAQNGTQPRHPVHHKPRHHNVRHRKTPQHKQPFNAQPSHEEHPNKPCANQQNEEHHHFGGEHQHPHHFESQHQHPRHFHQQPHHFGNFHAPPHVPQMTIHYHYHYGSCGCQQVQESCQPQEKANKKKHHKRHHHTTTTAPATEPVQTTPEEVSTTPEPTTRPSARFSPVAPIELHQRAEAFFKNPEYNSKRGKDGQKFDRDH